MSSKLLANRLVIATGDRSIRQIASELGMNPETVRRYMAGRAPSFEFLAAICRKYDVLGSWLLLGEGPRTHKEFVEQTLHEVKANEMLEMIARRLDSIEGRLVDVEKRDIRRARRPAAGSPTDIPSGRS